MRQEQEQEQAEEQKVAKKPQRVKIDATDIVKEYGDRVWASDISLDRLVIYEMGAKKVYAGDTAPSFKVHYQGRRTGRDQQEDDDAINVDDREVVDEIYKEVAGVDIPY